MLFRKHTLGVLAADLLLALVAWQVAFWLRFNLDVPPEFAQMAWTTAPLALAVYGLTLFALRVPRQVWRFTGLHELRQRERDGERLTIAQRQMWRAALGEPPLQRRRTDRQPTTREPA